MLHQLVFALAAVITVLELAPEHLCIGVMDLHMTVKVRWTPNIGGALYAHHATLGVFCGVGFVRCSSHSIGCWWCSRHRLAVPIKIGVMARNTGRIESWGESAFPDGSEGT